MRLTVKLRHVLVFAALALFGATARAQDILKQSTVYSREFLMVQTSDHINGLTGATVTCKISKAGATGVTPGGTISEVDSTNLPGVYKIAYTTTDTNTQGDLVANCTATGADPRTLQDQVVGIDVMDAAALGLSRIDAAISSRMATFTLPANFALQNIDANGRIKVLVGMTKGVAAPAFTFVMTDSTTQAPKPGLTVGSITKQYRLDSGTWQNLGGAITDKSNGEYNIDLSGVETNGNFVSLRFAATGANDTILTLLMSQ